MGRIRLRGIVTSADREGVMSLRRGYGAAALDAVAGYLATRPGADVLYTSCS